jgi:hypothetical protein
MLRETPSLRALPPSREANSAMELGLSAVSLSVPGNKEETNALFTVAAGNSDSEDYSDLLLSDH